MVEQKRLLLIYPDFLEEDKYSKNKLGNYSEGLASISAVVKGGGHDVKLYHELYMPEKQEFLDKVKSFDPDLIGFTARTTAIPFITEMAGWLDDNMPDIPVLIGGYHAILVPDECAKIRGIDIVCEGEGEYPILELMNSMRDGEMRTDILSMHYNLPDGTYKKNPVRPLIEDLDELPFPDFDLFDYENLDRSKNFTAVCSVFKPTPAKSI